MKQITQLNLILPGEKATVIKTENKGGIRRRFHDIGLIEGTKIECVGKSPLGDPSAFLIRGSVTALRSDDSRLITVEKEES